MIEVREDWPLRLGGTRQFVGSDLRVRRGDLVWDATSMDLELVSGVHALAQSIELAVKRDAGSVEQMRARLVDVVRGSSVAQYLDALHAIRHDEADIEFEFAAVGYAGVYVHRFGVTSFAGTHDCVPVSKDSVLIVDGVDQQLIEHLSRYPDDLLQLRPRRFEELVAELFSRMGYEVQLTRYSKDGGVDIFAVHKQGASPILTIVDCKRYAKERPIGPGMIRTIAGLREEHRANVAMIATTARFTKGARDLQVEKWPYEVALADFEQLRQWLKALGWNQTPSGMYMPTGSQSSTPLPTR